MITVDIQQKLGAFQLKARFEAPSGVTAIFGPSGSGKTSIVNAVAGLRRPDNGRIAVGGDVLFDSADRVNLPPHKRRIGYVFQDARLFPHMTVARNLHYGGSHDAAHVVDVLGLADLLDRMPAGLSGGERQRVALGRALMCNPQILLMDEPTGSMDHSTEAHVKQKLDEYSKGKTLLVITHRTALLEMVDKILVVDGGQIVANGPKDSVIEALRSGRIGKVS